jgi:hypothetical protein
VTVASKVIFAGGVDITSDKQVTDVVDIFDDRTGMYLAAVFSYYYLGSWSVSKLSVGRSHMCATSVGTKAFISGGNVFSSKATNVVDVYDASTGMISCSLSTISITNITTVQDFGVLRLSQSFTLIVQRPQ